MSAFLENVILKNNKLYNFIARRIELAGIEAREALHFSIKKILLFVIFIVAIFFSWALFLACITGLLAPIIEPWLVGTIVSSPAWVVILFFLALAHFVLALATYLLMKKKPSNALFELSREEFKKDRQWLRKGK